MNKIFLIISFLFIGFSSYCQSNYWRKSNQDLSANKLILDVGEHYQIFELNHNVLQKVLSSGTTSKISMPTSEGLFEEYVVFAKKSSSNQLADKFPDIKTYRGYKSSNPKDKIALTITNARVYAYIFSEAAEELKMVSKDTYLVYKKGVNQSLSEVISCGVSSPPAPQRSDVQSPSTNNRTSNTNQQWKNKTEGIRTLRLAVVAAGEYAEINGGTKAAVMANIISIINAANSISELDLGINYELIDSNDALIFIDKATDPYNIEANGISTDSNYLNLRTQTVVDSIIGKDNYDLGHLFIARDEDNPTPYGIGNAFGIGNVGTQEKGSGWSYFSKSTTNELGFIGLVSHEFGHQIGATHTFTNQPDGLVTQSELSAGRTIMSYGKINQPNLHYYHYHSINQIIENFKRIQFGIDFSKVGTLTPYAKEDPQNIDLTAYSIPIKTPFILTLPNELSDENYLYNWEQLDTDLVLNGTYWGSKSLKAPLFSSTSPGLNVERFFPRYERILANDFTDDENTLRENQGSSMLFETLSEVPRQFTFGFSLRDVSLSHSVYLYETKLNTVENSKPFEIVNEFGSPLPAGSTATIKWEISNTNDNPIDVSHVNILLSKDGGLNFDYVLAENTANDGSQTVVIPNISTETGRIKIEPVEHIFFTINPTNLTLVKSDLSFFNSSCEVELNKCNEYNQSINLQIQGNEANNVLANLSFSGVPQGVTLSLSKNQASINEVIKATFSNQTASSGTYTVTLKAEINGTILERQVDLTIFSQTPTSVVLSAPLAEQKITQNQVELKWEPSSSSSKFLLQISKNQNFDDVLVEKIIYGTSYLFKLLENSTTYYWRVKETAECLSSEFTVSSFQVVLGFDKKFRYASDIDETSDGMYPIQVTDSNVIKAVSVQVEVSKAATDLIRINSSKMSLIDPSGLSLVLVEKPSDRTNVDLNSITYWFTDEVEDFNAPIFNEATGKWQIKVLPEEGMDKFVGRNTLGIWNLKIENQSELSIGEVELKFLSSDEFKAPSAENKSVNLFKEEYKIELTGKNYLNESLVNSNLILTTLPKNGALVDAQGNALQLQIPYSIKDVYYVPKPNFQGLDQFNYQVEDTQFNLRSTTRKVLIDYKNIKPDLKIFDIYTAIKVGDSQILNLDLKNIELYDSYSFNVSAPSFGTLEISENSILYQATSVGEEQLELTYLVEGKQSISYIYITNYLSNNSIKEATQELKREDFDFRIGRTVAINADGTILASSQDIKWDESSEEWNKNYEGLIKIFSIQDDLYTQIGNSIQGEGINDRLGYVISLSGDGLRIAMATNHKAGCFSCLSTVDYVVVYEYVKGSDTWELLGEKIVFEGDIASVDIQSVDLNFDGSVLAVGQARQTINGSASGAVFTYEFNEATRSWIQKGSLLTPNFIDKPENFTDFGAQVRLNKVGNRLVLSQPYSVFNTSGVGKVFVFEYRGADWNLVGKPISGTNGSYSQFGKTVDINDQGDIIVISENYEVISSNEIYAGKAYSYKFNSESKEWETYGNVMRGPKTTIGGPIDDWNSTLNNETFQNAKVSINGAGDKIALSLKVPDWLEINNKPIHFINVFNFDSGSSSWTSNSEPFATEPYQQVHRPTYNESVISSKGTKVFFGSGKQIGLHSDETFIKVFDATSIADNQAPSLVLTNPYTLRISESGNFVLEATSLDNGSTDNVGITELFLSKSTFTCADLGENKITVTAKDASGNTSTAEVTVIVVDEIKPTLKAKTSYTIKLDGSGTATLKWEDIDEGSSDNCGISQRTLSKTEFSRKEGGDNKVTYTVTDASGNTSSTEITVRVDVVLSAPERANKGNSIKAYPNPVNDYLYLEFTEGMRSDAVRGSTLVDASGRVIGAIVLEEVGNGQLGFSTQELKAGMYFLRLSTRDTLHLIKFTVIH